MTETDIPAVGALAKRIWQAHYTSIITQAQIDYMLPRSYSAEALARQMGEGQRFLLVEISGEIVGYLSVGALSKIENPILRGTSTPLPLGEVGEANAETGEGAHPPPKAAAHLLTSPDGRGDTDYFLHKFYLAPECQGRGMGKAMLAELLRLMPEIRRLRLQVHRRNVDSWNFYLKQGFVIEREADFDIGEGFQMNDYVMEKRIAIV